MRLFGCFTRFGGRFYSGQQFRFGAVFAEGIFIGTLGVMFVVTWSVATLFNVACVFVVHNLSFTAADRLAAADALFPSIEQDGTA